MLMGHCSQAYGTLAQKIKRGRLFAFPLLLGLKKGFRTSNFQWNEPPIKLLHSPLLFEAARKTDFWSIDGKFRKALIICFGDGDGLKNMFKLC